MNRRAWLGHLQARLGRRRLVYFGTRGADARTLTDLPNFDAIFSQIAPSGLAGVSEHCLETEKQLRVDLDRYSIDLDPAPEVGSLRRKLLAAFDGPAAVLPYRSCAVLASAWFPRCDRVLHLGMFHEKQACFEHKPWVETQLSAAGIRVVPWTYYTDDERPLIAEALRHRALVVRANRSDGGTGVRLVGGPGELDALWPEHEDGFVGVAPYLEGIPLNVNACAFPGGEVSVHGASVQLVGVPGCTDRRFGYCGNDFGAVAALDPAALDELDRTVRAVGRWLDRHGYVGAFGIDALLSGGRVYVVELNPRFQGSSRLAAALDADDGRADLFLAHVGAHLGAEPPDGATVAELARRGPAAHMVVHAPAEVRVAGEPPRVPRARGLDLVPEPGVVVSGGAILTDIVARVVVSRDGRTLDDESAAAVAAAGAWSTAANARD